MWCFILVALSWCAALRLLLELSSLVCTRTHSFLLFSMYLSHYPIHVGYNPPTSPLFFEIPSSVHASILSHPILFFLFCDKYLYTIIFFNFSYDPLTSIPLCDFSPSVTRKILHDKCVSFLIVECFS